MQTIAEKIIHFYKTIDFQGKLPEKVRLLNPFKDNPNILPIFEAFYTKFYGDNKPRKLILGINPGRFGAGQTGIPFTDSERLENDCGIPMPVLKTRELSAVFVYNVIEAYGGVSEFYDQYYISSVCPLGFTTQNKRGNWVNYNYYDSTALTEAVYDFIKESLLTQISFGLETDRVFCLGTGKNFKFLNAFNKKEKLFGKIIPLPHPRYVMQYKTKMKDTYVENYLAALQ